MSTETDRELLQASAEKLAEELPEEEREAFKADYVEILGNLNAAVNTRISALTEDLVPFVVGLGSPALTDRFTTTAVQAVRIVSNTLLQVLGPFYDPAVRSLITEAIQDAVHLSNAAVVEQQRRIEERRGKRVD